MVIVGVNHGATSSGWRLRDGGAALFADGCILSAIGEERLSRVKKDCGYERSLPFVLTQNGLTYSDVDLVVHSTCCEPQRTSLGHPIEDVVSTLSCGHHHSHACSAYFTSPFEESLVVVADASGNVLDGNQSTEWWTCSREQQTYFIARGRNIERVGDDFSEPLEVGLGEMYRIFTYYLGWLDSQQAGKVMALAGLLGGTKLPNLNLYSKWSDRWISRIRNSPFKPIENLVAFLGSSGFPRYTPRPPGGEIRPHHIELAALVQSELERVMCDVVRSLVKRTGITNLCLAGGVAYNCKMASILRERTPIKSIFIHPSSGDHGQCVGNAFFGALSADCYIRRADWFSPYLGGEYHVDETTLKRMVSDYFRDDVLVRKSSDVAQDAARLLANGGVIGWYQGRSEYGPRALGNRSILASPASVSYRDLNTLKGREHFMPFAPAIRIEDVKFFLDYNVEEPYMAAAHHIKPEVLRHPSLAHSDGSARIQTVSRQTNPRFHSLLSHYASLVELPALINTSFNASGEPIVETVQDAVRTFAKMKLNALIVNDHVVTLE